MKVTKLKLNLQLFAEGGAGASGDGTGSAGAATGGNDVQAAAEQVTGENTQAAAEDRAALYQKFKADYKAEFDSEVQGIIKGRMKSAKENEKAAKEYREKADKLISFMADKYGLQSTDLEGLLSAAERDNSYYDDLAMKNGTTPEREKEIRRMERENAQLKASQDAAFKSQQEAQRVQMLLQQEAEVKALYPDFDLKTEMANNPQFAKLCEIAGYTGMSLLNAYQSSNLDKIMAGGMQYAAKQAARKAQASVENNSKRPTENGLNKAQGQAETKVDPSKFTLEESNRWAAAAMRGETVTFR